MDRQVPVYLDGDLVELDIRLGTHPRPASFDDVALSLEGMTSPEQGIPMHRRADGTFFVQLDIPDEVVRYQLIGVASGARTNGTSQHQRFHYRGAGSYDSVLDNALGTVSIVFDPAKLPPANRAGRVHYRQPHSRAARIGTIASRMDERERVHEQAVRRHKRAIDVDAQRTLRRLRTAFATARRTVERERRLSSDMLVRQALALELFAILDHVYRIDALSTEHRPNTDRTPFAEHLMTEIVVASPIWTVAPRQVVRMARARGSLLEYRAFVEGVADALPDRAQAASLILELLADAYRGANIERARHYFQRLATEFASTPAAVLAARFDPNRPIVPGAPVPAFAFSSMDDSAVTISSTGLRGTVYLIDFWATWCRPCIDEMPRLHREYRAYKERGFTIVSVAVYDKVHAIRSLRAEQWPMPWQHAFIDDARADDITATFDITALPSTILVGADGRILAVGESARGRALSDELARRFLRK